MTRKEQNRQTQTRSGPEGLSSRRTPSADCAGMGPPKNREFRTRNSRIQVEKCAQSATGGRRTARVITGTVVRARDARRAGSPPLCLSLAVLAPRIGRYPSQRATMGPARSLFQNTFRSRKRVKRKIW